MSKETVITFTLPQYTPVGRDGAIKELMVDGEMWVPKSVADALTRKLASITQELTDSRKNLVMVTNNIRATLAVVREP